MIVDYDTIYIIFKNDTSCLGLIWKSIPCIEAFLFGIFAEKGLSIIWLILLPLNGVLLFYFMPINSKSDQLGRLLILNHIIDRIESI